MDTLTPVRLTPSHAPDVHVTIDDTGRLILTTATYRAVLTPVRGPRAGIAGRYSIDGQTIGQA